MNTVAIIEARMLSTRLPGKVMLEVQGKSFLQHMIERVLQAEHITDVCVATSSHESCTPIVDLCNSMSIDCFRGSEEDVLDRVTKAGQYMNADVIVELCGDSPLIDPNIIDSVVEFYYNTEADFCSNSVNRSHPIGLDVKVFSQEVIEEVDKVTNNPDDREHVSLYIYEHPERYKVVHYPSALTKSDIDHRLTLDTPDDKHLISLIFDKLYPENQNFNLADILSLLEQNPKLALINNHISQKSPHSEGKQC